MGEALCAIIKKILIIEFLFQNKDIITILSGIGTFIASLIAIFTLIEVKKQRLSLYQPDLLIKSFVASISKSPLILKQDELLQYRVTDFNDYSKKYRDAKFEPSPKYKVENLGFGVAKQISCEWNFDTSKAIKLLKTKIPEEFLYTNMSDLNLHILNKRFEQDFHYSANDKIDKHQIDYISPVNIEKHYHYHTIPEILIFTHYLFLLFEKKLLNTKGSNFHILEFNDYNFPKPILKVRYKDLNNKLYTKKYKFKVSAVVSQIEETLDLEQDFAYLQFKVM